MTRFRTVALPPRSPTVSGGLDAMPRDLLGFYERLRHIPLGVWAAAAATPTATDVAPGGTATDARHRLRQIVDGMPHVAAQSRRRVLDLVAAAEGFVHPSVLARMKKSALTAALALVARPALDEDDFAQLYGPFATLIPPHALAAGPDGPVQPA